MKALSAVKATVIDDDAFRLLAFPLGGPIPSKASPHGVDLDGQWFDPGVDIKREWFPYRIVDWTHRQPGWSGDKITPDLIAGKAIPDDELTEEEGIWITVWLKHGERRVELIRKLAERGGQLFGSSETGPGMGRIRTAKGDIVPWSRHTPGAIVEWPYIRQTLSTSPQNTYSVLRPMKGLIDAYRIDGAEPTDAFFDDLARYVDNLYAEPSADLSGDADAKAGRVIAARNEARLREGIEELERDGWHPLRRREAIARFREILDELEEVLTPI